MTTPKPIAIGGVGGSGTRLLAAILMELGVSFPGPLNASLDNLWFTLLFKRRGALVDADADFALLTEMFLERLRSGRKAPERAAALIEKIVHTPRRGHSQSDLAALAQTFCEDDKSSALPEDAQFAWKEPNTHVVLERLLNCAPGLRYIHLERHGLDMAYSDNQNQLLLWGPVLLDRAVEIGPRDSLAFWCAAHKRLDRLAVNHRDHILCIKYEDLCQDTDGVAKRVAEFLNLPVSQAKLIAIRKQCAPPASLGRFRDRPLDAFSPADVEYVASRGYPVE